MWSSGGTGRVRQPKPLSSLAEESWREFTRAHEFPCACWMLPVLVRSPQPSVDFMRCTLVALCAGEAICCGISRHDGDERQPEVADLDQHAVERRLVGQWPSESGFTIGSIRDCQPVKLDRPGVVEMSPDGDDTVDWHDCLLSP